MIGKCDEIINDKSVFEVIGKIFDREISIAFTVSNYLDGKDLSTGFGCKGMCGRNSEGLHQTGSFEAKTYNVCGEPKVKTHEELVTDAKKKAANYPKNIEERRRRRMRFRRF